MKKTKILYIALAVLIIYMFASIFVTVGLTGGRDIADFTDRDKTIFTVFAILEVFAVVLLFVVALSIRKASGAGPMPKPKLSPYDKALKKRDAATLGVSFAVSFIFALLGAILLKGRVSEDTLAIAFLVLVSVQALLLLGNYFTSSAYIKRFEARSHSEMAAFLYSHREHADRSAKRLLCKLRTLLVLTNVYTVLVALNGVALSFVSAGLGLWSFMTLLSTLVIYAAAARIRLPYPKVLFTKDNGYVDDAEFPELYSVAREAANILGVKGNIKIVILADCTAGIRRFGSNISIQIGAMLFATMSREELKNILLHEFAHLKNEEAPSSTVTEHYWWLTESGIGGALSKAADIFFKLPDTIYGINYSLYSYASTISAEEKADSAMREYGDPKYAGSSLLKLKYYELYSWEKGSYDTSASCISEELEANIVKEEFNGFKEQTEKRSDFWNKLIDVEIISRSATHPTIKMRLEAIGHTDYSIHESPDSDSYKSEQKKIIEHVDNNIYSIRKENYENERSEVYLEPLETVTKWEESDKEIGDDYREIIFAYRQLGRVSEADALCERIINELPDSANHYAYFIKGCTLLHSFDESGIEYIYHAIESNHNYIEEGMQTIGQFCCISGRQDDLDVYRERVMTLMDEKKTKYSELERITPKDNLSSEKLPEELREGLLSLIGTMSDLIDEVYVVRKTITSDFFASVVIIKTKDGIDPKADNELFNKFFLYLDAQEWQFTLFDAKGVPMNIIKKIPLSLFYGEKDNSVDIRRYLP
ncbi:MAG: M48 family metalloprotease [Clostridia bacterium]|nr:M48 family metalloprotease [Clostridia bacterium]